jgi:hypothetical protein
MLRNFAFTFRFSFHLYWIGWLQLRKDLPRLGFSRHPGGRFRARTADVGVRDLGRSDGRKAGIVDDPLRLFPIGLNMDPDNGHIGSCRFRDW